MEMVRSQLFDGITQQECERMFICFGAREKSYEQGDVICEFVGGSKVVGVLLSGSGTNFHRPSISVAKTLSWLYMPQ